MSAVLFACGIQLLILGVVGEYIGRLMGATFKRPVYVVENRVNAARQGKAHGALHDASPIP
jgi:undecaprenyl-phosphate 4-deoxy-4-formamido-L-arabinose transferase